MKEKYFVKNVSCSACKSIIENSLDIDEINSANLDLIDKILIVDYDEKRITREKMFSILKKEGYEARTYEDAFKLNNKMKKRVLITMILWGILFIIGMSHIFDDLIKNHLVNALVQFGLTTLIIIFNFDYYKSGIPKLFKGHSNMDTLVSLGSLASYIYGIYAIVLLVLGKSHPHLYFESAGTILALVTLGKYLEDNAKKKTNVSFKNLIELSPKTVLLETEEEKEISLVEKGDILLLKPGMIAPVDGIVVDGYASMDESLITGESVPVEKEIGSSILSGTSNKNGIIKYEASSGSRDSTLSKIINLVENASFSKTKISKLVDRISRFFVPIVIALAIISFIVWFFVKDFNFALNIMISVFVISCPCALGLATPLAIVTATNKALDMQILLKEASSLEILHKVDTIVLDKTGTITLGEPVVINVKTFDYEEKEFLLISRALEKSSEHPFAKAILNYTEDLETIEIKEFKAHSGLGIKGYIKDKLYFAGNKKFMIENNILISDEIMEYADRSAGSGITPLFFSDEKRIIGIIEVGDKIKENSVKAIEYFKKMNKDVIILTGDNKKTADTINNVVKADMVYAELLPEDKAKHIEELKKLNKTVLMVGDGLNDSLALQTADCSMAISKGVEISIENSDIVLLKDDLLSAVNCFILSKATFSNIKLSLFWAFIYNIICIPFAAGAFYFWLEITLNPMIASFAMGISSICVVLNALRLRKVREVKQ